MDNIITKTETASTSTSESTNNGTKSSVLGNIKVLSSWSEEKINHNKPWRQVIIRRIADGADNNENAPRDNISNQSV